MRKIVVAVTAATLALSMLLLAIRPPAVSGYDSSTPVNRRSSPRPGPEQRFQVFFANTARRLDRWHRNPGRSSRVPRGQGDLQRAGRHRSHVERRLTSATRYATSTQTSVALGLSPPSSTPSRRRPASRRARTASTATWSSPRRVSGSPRATTRRHRRRRRRRGDHHLADPGVGTANGARRSRSPVAASCAPRRSRPSTSAAAPRL
jgi:hypothetical protein